jgi:hypothetical protein
MMVELAGENDGAIGRPISESRRLWAAEVAYD